MRFFFTVFCLLFGAISECSEIIKENIGNARAGDFTVVSFDKNLSFYRVADNDGRILHLEEACIHETHFRKWGLSFREWALKGCPGSGSQIVYKIDIRNGHLES